ncbi:MAG TPA: DUF374 domain-containing protein [Patescibacteria group bacterium]|nr:DUF374 domain-containing protein [Patescibacteria group bacterium]
MWRTRLALEIGPRLASGFIRLLRRLIRLAWVNDEVVLEQHRAGRPYVHAFFHDQLLLMTYSYKGARFGRRLAVLASRHRDGEYVSRTLERFGHLMVRGSSGRGGADGLRQIVRQLRAGLDGAIAVDGPRGPRHRAQMGAIEAARLGRAPLIPVAFAAGGKKNFVRGIASRSRTRSGGVSLSTVSRLRSLRTPIAA